MKEAPAVTEENEGQKRRWEASGVFVPACLLIGMGVGFLVDQIPAGLFIGLGAGLVLMAVTHIAFRR